MTKHTFLKYCRSKIQRIEQVAGKNSWVTPMAIGAVVDATPSQYIHVHTLNELLEKMHGSTHASHEAVLKQKPSDTPQIYF